MKYFHEITGLRIYLALWVAVGHALELAGYHAGVNAAQDMILSNRDAVSVFMIVSGFVITNLIVSRNEPYPRYIVRRFFRLYPGFLVACLIGYFLTDNWVHIVDTVPWHATADWVSYSQTVRVLNDEVITNFWPHLALHAVMFHGAVPAEVLNRAAMTFLPAAWSISLEWQFYLVAPAVFVALRRGWSTAVMLLVAAGLYLAYQSGLFGTYQSRSMLLAGLPFFAIGIASRLNYERLARLNVVPLLAVAGFALLVGVLVKSPLAVGGWTAFLLLSLLRPFSRRLATVFDLMFQSRVALILGEVSYSLYLLHRPVQVALGSLAVDRWHLTHPLMLAVQLAGIVIAVPLSILMYHAIERPGIRLGSIVAARLFQPARASPPAKAKEKSVAGAVATGVARA